MTFDILVNAGSGNGLWPDDPKPIPEAIVPYPYDQLGHKDNALPVQNDPHLSITKYKIRRPVRTIIL